MLGAYPLNRCVLECVGKIRRRLACEGYVHELVRVLDGASREHKMKRAAVVAASLDPTREFNDWLDDHRPEDSVRVRRTKLCA
jgi:hypothetical protein